QIGRPGDGCGDVDLRPGQPRAARLPLSAWRAAWRWASFRPPPGILPPLGLPELRHAVAEHVRRTYGALPPGREVVVTTGTVAGLRAVLAVLGLSGPDVAVQEPIAPSLWRAAQGGTGRPVAVPVDHEGARIDRVPDRCPALLLCPDSAVASGVLSAERRYRTVRRPGTWLVEVGCDGVLPAAAQRLPRLLSLAAPETSVLVGGFGEVFAPVLGIGFALVPEELSGAIGRYLADCSGQPPYVSQLALARLLRDGTVERVMHRLDRDDRSGLDLTRAALDCVTLERTGRPAAPDVGVPVTGMRGTALLPLPGADAATVAARLRDRGVRVGTLAPYHFSAAPVPPALVVGYGHLTEPALRHGLERLAAALPAALSAAPPTAPRAALPATPPAALPADRRSSEG
ncbi:hypothetical protein, partial [Rugosimonospora africana]|uniref:hypothetical protein n=1 Tax=Rugosimonospora africana TaxID=556532 RepID=UPI0019433490